MVLAGERFLVARVGEAEGTSVEEGVRWLGSILSGLTGWSTGARQGRRSWEGNPWASH